MNNEIETNEERHRQDGLPRQGSGLDMPTQDLQVRAVLVGADGYTSGQSRNEAASRQTLPSDWLDAADLTIDAGSRHVAQTTDRAESAPVTSTGGKPAGYLITGGEDCRIRFWDLGSPGKSCSFGRE